LTTVPELFKTKTPFSSKTLTSGDKWNNHCNSNSDPVTKSIISISSACLSNVTDLDIRVFTILQSITYLHLSYSSFQTILVLVLFLEVKLIKNGSLTSKGFCSISNATVLCIKVDLIILRIPKSSV